MSAVQRTIPFNVRKVNSRSSFYGKNKSTVVKQDFSNATVRSKSSESKRTPTVKKVVVLTSSESESSDSDLENAVVEPKGNATCRRKQNDYRTPTKKRNGQESDDKDGGTPPKLKKTEAKLSPSSPTTPTGLLGLLNLGTAKGEVEPRLSPKQLFNGNNFKEARKALHVSLPASLPGREKELEELREFLSNSLKTGRSGSLYISGPPGTGKTASLSKIMREKEFAESFKAVYVNCTAIKSGGAIYGKIVDDLGIERSKTEAANKTLVEKYIASEQKTLLLILDEIDQLSSRKQLVLYSIFEWPSKPNYKLVLIGIANALDLTDRILPRLRARCGLKPRLMHFAPYSKEQIVEIISKRLSEANVSNVLNATAVQMLAAKVAAISGDIRKALDIGRRVIEIADSRRVSQILQPSKNNGINTGDNSPNKQQQTQRDRPIALTEVVELLNTVYGGALNSNNDESKFPLQQKLALCSLMLILNKGRNKDVIMGKLYEVYKKVCKKRSLNILDISEFVSLCRLVETRGVIRIVGKNEPRLSKVYLQLDQEELTAALQDKAMIAEIVQDVSCL